MKGCANGWADGRSVVFSRSSRFKVASSHSWRDISTEINVLLPWIILQRPVLNTLPILSDSCCKPYTGCSRIATLLVQ
jgi:hypothetical protein